MLFIHVVPQIDDRRVGSARQRTEYWRLVGEAHPTVWLRDSAEDKSLLAAAPLPRKPYWIEHVNESLTEAELLAIRRSVHRGRPFGDESWSDEAVRRLNLETTLRPRGRPKTTTIGS